MGVVLIPGCFIQYMCSPDKSIKHVYAYVNMHSGTYVHRCVHICLFVRASGRSRKKKSNFAGFSGTNSRKKRPISRNFTEIFEASFAEKRLVKTADFAGKRLVLR